MSSSKILRFIFFGLVLLLASIQTIGATTTLYYNHPDHLGGTTLVTKAGAQNELVDYYPYGNIRFDQQSTAFKENHKFSGHIQDDTGLIYMGQRYYDPTIGRFLSQDPAFLAIGNQEKLKQITNQDQEQLLADPQGLNSYAYARNNPLKYIDKDGEFAQVLIGAGAGIAGQYAYDVYNNVQANGLSANAFYSGLSSPGTYLTRGTQGAILGLTGGAVGALTASVAGQAAIVGGVSAAVGIAGNAYLGEPITSQSVIADSVIGGLTFGAGKFVPGVPGRLPNFGTQAFFAGKHTQQSALKIGLESTASYFSTLVGNGSFEGIGNIFGPSSQVTSPSRNESGSGNFTSPSPIIREKK